MQPQQEVGGSNISQELFATCTLDSPVGVSTWVVTSSLANNLTKGYSMNSPPESSCKSYSHEMHVAHPPLTSLPSHVVSTIEQPVVPTLFQRRMSNNGVKRLQPLSSSALMSEVFPLHLSTAVYPSQASSPFGSFHCSGSYSAPHTPRDLHSSNTEYYAHATELATSSLANLSSPPSPEETVSIIEDGTVTNYSATNVDLAIADSWAPRTSADAETIGESNHSYRAPEQSIEKPQTLEPSTAETKNYPSDSNTDKFSNFRLSRRRERNRVAARRSREKRSQFMMDLQNHNILLQQQLVMYRSQLETCMEELCHYRRLYPAPSISTGVTPSATPGPSTMSTGGMGHAPLHVQPLHSSALEATLQSIGQVSPVYPVVTSHETESPLYSECTSPIHITSFPPGNLHGYQ
ncbi:hypothetical protein IWQ61_002941 [Dispira simplex]|nr:hypothetical protein IWQ61_002941 [Dispira simplex]